MDEQDPPSAQNVPRPISRHAVLQAMGGAAVMGAVALGTGGTPAATLTRPRPRQALLLRSATRRALSAAAPDFAAQVTRSTDMLSLGFEFYNMKLSTATSPAQVVPIDTTQPSYMVVVFPPQHFGEQAIPYPNPPPAGWPSDPPYGGVLAAESGSRSGCPARSTSPSRHCSHGRR